MAELIAMLEGDGSLGALRNGWVQHPSGFGIRLESGMLAFALIRVVLNGGSSDEFLERARQFADSCTGAAASYIPLTGVSVKQTACLDDSVDLIPWSEVPSSWHKDQFEEQQAHHTPLGPTAIYSQFRPYATAAIRVRMSDSQILFSSAKDAKLLDATRSYRASAQVSIVRDVLRCLTALKACPIAEIGRWDQFDDGFVNNIASGGVGTSLASMFDMALGQSSRAPIEICPRDISLLYKKFRTMKSKEVAVLRIALDRLRQATMRSDLVDRAIDLGIVLEVMLLHDNDRNPRGEFRFRTAVRGATFLGGNKLERQKTYQLLKKAYDLRSTAVHSGVIEAKKQAATPTKQILRDVADKCSQIASTLIDNGSFPNWEEDYVIGGDGAVTQ